MKASTIERRRIKGGLKTKLSNQEQLNMAGRLSEVTRKEIDELLLLTEALRRFRQQVPSKRKPIGSPSRVSTTRTK